MAYDLSVFNGTGTSNMLNVVTHVNTASGGLFAVLLLVAIWIGFFMYFKKQDDKLDFVISSTATGIISMLFLFVDLLTWEITAVFVSVFIISWLVYWVT